LLRAKQLVDVSCAQAVLAQQQGREREGAQRTSRFEREKERKGVAKRLREAERKGGGGREGGERGARGDATRASRASDMRH
jgi:hypothetical protein